LPEVVGDVGIFVDPFDYRDIARGLEQGIHDTELRQRLARDGVEHARSFSWKRMGEQTLDIYERCLPGGRV
jgi:glycosyltransferase involved in cell wall biosynthesis